MEWSDRGLVLAKGIFREYDVWLRVLFKEHGVQTVLAFGGLHSRRRFVGCLDLLNLLECRVKVKGNYLYLTEALLLKGPGTLRSIPSRQGLAMNLVKLVDGLSVPQDLAGETLRLLEEGLELLSREYVSQTLPLFFRLRLMAILGYAPDFLHCCLCRKDLVEKSFFCVEEGGPMCEDCRSRFGGARRTGAFLEPSTLKLLQLVREEDPLSWPQWAEREEGASSFLEPGQRRAASQCIDGILAYHVGLAWEKGRFVRT